MNRPHGTRPSPGVIAALVILSLGVGCQDYQVARIPKGDSYVQEEPARPVDVLWVIDNSATMTEEQEALASSFQDFAEVLYQTSVDFQIGVITTDAEADLGLLVGEILTPDTEEIDAAFAEQAAVGVRGSREEQPLEAIRLATSIDALGAGNSALFRDDADLQIIIVSDEDDQSSDAVTVYLQALSIFRSSTAYRISLVGGPLPEGCASAIASAEAAVRLHEAVDATAGVFKSICEDDMGPVMKSIAFNTTGMTDTFALSLLPDLASLEVKVDGVLMHQRPSDGWQYDASSNSVVLDGLAVPRPGQTVNLEYFEIFSVGDTGS